MKSCLSNCSCTVQPTSRSLILLEAYSSGGLFDGCSVSALERPSVWVSAKLQQSVGEEGVGEGALKDVILMIMLFA